MTKAEEFVGLALLGRDMAHLAHWKTKSYAEHKALNTFYDELLELIDGFVEQYQGYTGKRMDIERAANRDGDIREVLEDFGRPFEIVFVDDVSRDRTREILREIVAALTSEEAAA